MDPWGALAEFVLGRLKESAAAAWAKFLFELAFSAVVSFLIICGAALVTGGEAGFSIGAGMVAAALSLTVLFRRENSKLTKGMLVVLPEAEAAKEIATDFETIQKSK